MTKDKIKDILDMIDTLQEQLLAGFADLLLSRRSFKGFKNDLGKFEVKKTQ